MVDQTLTVSQAARAKLFARKLQAFKSRTMEEIWDFGAELAREKDLCGHGGWSHWLERAGLGERTARRWIQVHERYRREEVGRFPNMVEALLTHSPEPDDPPDVPKNTDDPNSVKSDTMSVLGTEDQSVASDLPETESREGVPVDAKDEGTGERVPATLETDTEEEDPPPPPPKKIDLLKGENTALRRKVEELTEEVLEAKVVASAYEDGESGSEAVRMSKVRELAQENRRLRQRVNELKNEVATYQRRVKHLDKLLGGRA